MDRTRRLEIYGPDHKVRCYLSQNDNINNCRVHTELNGTSTLSFSFFAEGDKLLETLDPENRIRADGREYSVLKDEALSFARSQGNVRMCAVTAWELQYLLIYRYQTITNDPTATDPKGNDVTILSGEKITSAYWVDGALRSNPFPVGSAAYCLHCLLDGSGWKIQGCDVDNTIKYDLETRNLNIWENIEQALKLWGGMLEWNSVNKTVFWHDEEKWQTFDGFQIKYTKNMRSLERKQSNKFYTRLFVYGENHLSLQKVNGGKEYLDDFTYSKQLLCGSIENSDIYEPESLLQWGKQQHKKLCRPRSSYAGSAVDLSKISNYQDISPILGHLADVIDADVTENGKERKRIILYEYDFFRPWDCNIEIGDIIDNFAKKYVDLLHISKKADSTVDSGGNINGGTIKPGTYPELNELDEEIHILIRDETGKLYSKIDVTATEIRSEVANVDQGLKTIISQTASEIRQEAIDTKNGLNSLISQTAREIRQEVSDTKNGLTSLVSQTAEQLRVEMNNTAAGLRNEISITASGLSAKISDLDRGLTGEINATAKELRSEYRDANSDLSSRITQNARSISLQASEINLKANKTTVDGLVEFKTGLVKGTTTISGGCIKTNTLSAEQLIMPNSTIGARWTSKEVCWKITTKPMSVVTAVDFAKKKVTLSTVTGVASTSQGTIYFIGRAQL